MCGITGIFNRKGDKVDANLLDRMTDRLEHRGPDGRGTYVFENVGLGHRRLSIIGLSDGAQPMSNEDGLVWVTYNGEIYNYISLREELQALGYSFKSKSDTEVIVHGYSAWGTKVIEKLRGIFAFVVLDQVKRQLFVGRDRLGVKPLYYVATPEHFLFASEPKALLLHPAVPRHPNFDALSLYLRYGYVPAPMCAFDGIKQVEPGRFLIITETEVTEKTYWRPGPIGGNIRQHDYGRLDELITESIDIELMSEVPLGAFLSGGIDSSIVAAAMARSSRLDAAPRTFCIGFPEPKYDESSYSEAIANHLALSHSVDMVTISELDILDRLVDVYDEPFADSSAIPTFFLCEMAKKYVTVALSGDGGDEVFAGYRRYQKLNGVSQMSAPTRSMIAKLADLYPRTIRGQRRLRKYASSIAEQYENDLCIFPEYMLSSVVEPELCREVDWSLAAHFEQAPCENPIAKAQWCDLMTYLPNDILTKVDRASMANGLEVRVPLLDHEFLEWSFGLGLSQTFAQGRGKWALKEHLAQFVPQSLFDRPKMGFGVPLEYWLTKNGGLTQIAASLRANHPKGTFYSPIRPEAVDVLLPRTGGWDLSAGAWSLLFLEAWWQKNFV
ncbi:MAG: asparagine synthase (glutamine-hydrolyzing) [Myxococcota bacterium]|nr:asparagine synthase (glutamine-hydrolyzing) [Myxococcota bacterium]